MHDDTFTQREISIEWTLVEVTPEAAAESTGYVTRYVAQEVKQKYAAAGEVPVRIQWRAWREVIPCVPELIEGWTPSNAWIRDMPTPSRIVCMGRPDLPGAAVQYVEVNESGDHS
jgi:hypothetical protein